MYLDNPDQWSRVDQYFTDLLIPADPTLEAALPASATAGLPPHNVSPAQGKLLQVLVQMQGAQRVLEIGTLGGYSAIWMARALPADGCLVTLEANAQYAAIARDNIQRAGVDSLVDMRIGPATETLAQLTAEAVPPFDLIFVDADKPSNPAYLKAVVPLSRPGTVIIADNVVREGAVVDAASTDPKVQGIRQFTEQVAANPRLTATVVQTVGCKGYDGFVLARVIATP